MSGANGEFQNGLDLACDDAFFAVGPRCGMTLTEVQSSSGMERSSMHAWLCCTQDDKPDAASG